jgi:hypothetical protein
MMRTHYAAWIGLLIIAALTVTAAEAQGPSPFATAAKHAGMAAQAKGLAAIHQHLQHVLNCLEGSTGPDYKKVAGNP